MNDNRQWLKLNEILFRVNTAIPIVATRCHQIYKSPLKSENDIFYNNRNELHPVFATQTLVVQYPINEVMLYFSM